MSVGSGKDDLNELVEPQNTHTRTHTRIHTTADGGDREQQIQNVLGEALQARTPPVQRREGHSRVLHTSKVPGPLLDPRALWGGEGGPQPAAPGVCR